MFFMDERVLVNAAENFFQAIVWNREYSRVFDPKRYLGLIFDDFSIILSSLIESYV